MSSWSLVRLIAGTAVCVVLPASADAQGRRAPRETVADKTFRDCPTCPPMVRLPAGEFMMGSPEGELRRGADEGPQHLVTMGRGFAIAKYEVTFAEWDACVAKGGCTHKPSDEKWGRGAQPVVNISWDDAVQFVRWLANSTGKDYRLPTEAEWEYAARGVSSASQPTLAFSTGATISYKQANYDANFIYGPGRIGVYRQKPLEVGSLPANAFGLHDIHGNVWEWVEDCYKPNYREAPADGSAVTTPGCRLHVLRGGSWNYYPWALRSAHRYATPGDVRLNNVGLRVVRSL